MKKNILIAFLAVCLLSVSVVSADIVDWNCDDDGDGAIVMDTPAWNYDSGSGEYTLSMAGTQYWAPAHVEGDFTTDTEEDPTVWIIETVDNQTTFDWTGYQILIGMTKNFTISTSVIAPDDWVFEIIQPSVLGGGQEIPNGGTGWLGTIDYSVGTGSPIEIGQSGDFGFKISFLGSVEFCTEQTPIPEPATLALLGIGVLASMRRRR
ncbi:MAG: hypothetical protein A2173_09870 [Planctomycetes bacterium RBG_13_44_8b]|nr:MAG: hypothetical protein A2173_09870 [Planctomycetes bacterium RBG_13_44_8b]